MPELNGNSLDILEENIKNLRQLFPEVECDGKIDFDMLRQILGEYVDDDKERYNFKWNGKGKALRFSQTPSTGTLRPCKEESKDWDDTQNLYIEGDNLEVLKILQKSYHGKIKMIYIDPPYNTGKDFVYPDNYHDSLENYKAITGQTDEEGRKISTNTETSGRFHTDWLNMMYPRLRLARNLLTDDGVIFISIGDDEIDNLKKMCNEIFGEDNFIAQVCIVTGANQSGEGVLIQKNVEYCISYAKNINYTNINRVDKTEESFRNLNDAPTPLETRFDMGYSIYYNPNSNDMIPMYDYDKEKIYTNDETVVYSDNADLIAKGYIPVRPGQRNGKLHRWRWGYDTFLERKSEIVMFESSNKYIPKFKQQGYNAPKNIQNFSGGATDLKKIFGEQTPFDYPKGLSFINYLCSIGMDDNAIILDFFSGSATTAHAVMQLNAEDGGNRRFICVQLPEPTSDSSEAFKAGYKNICEIGKERIRRAGEKIKTEIESGNEQLKIDEEPKTVPDIGFKVFKLDSSNLKKWNPDFDNLELSLDDMINNYVPDRTEEDVVYEFMLKMGLDLSYPVDVTEIDGKKIYSIGFGALMMCLDDNITVSVAEGMVKMYKELAPETWKVIFKDEGFADDCTKTNIKLTLIQAGLEEDAFTTV